MAINLTSSGEIILKKNKIMILLYFSPPSGGMKHLDGMFPSVFR